MMQPTLERSTTPAPTSLIIGTGDSRHGLYRVDFDPITGAFGQVAPALPEPDLNFVVADPIHHRLYAVGEGPAKVLALAVDPATGAITELNRQAVEGRDPCHVAFDATRRTVIVSTYTGGTLNAFPVLADGTLGARSALFTHTGSGPDTERQEKAHLHSATLSADGRFAYACDLGTDEVTVYRLGDTPGEVNAPAVAPGRVPAGHGPRHAKISGDGRFLYVLNELIGSVTVFARDADDGALTAIETVSTLTGAFIGFNNSAEIHLHSAPGEPFVYVTNRGPNLVTVLKRDASSGRLISIQLLGTGGNHPRNFALSPDSRWLICANRYDNELRTLAVNPVTGLLSATPAQACVPDPCCVLFPGFR